MKTVADLLREMSGARQQNAYAAEPGSANVAPRAAPPAEFRTTLGPLDEMAFRQWTREKNVPFDPNANSSDYDMRGFWRGLQQGDPRAVSAMNPNDNAMHYPDVWKTPRHTTFSGESQWSAPGGPQWNEQDQLVSPGQRILFDERRSR